MNTHRLSLLWANTATATTIFRAEVDLRSLPYGYHSTRLSSKVSQQNDCGCPGRFFAVLACYLVPHSSDRKTGASAGIQYFERYVGTT